MHGEAYRPGAAPLLRRLLRRRSRNAEGVMRKLRRYLPIDQGVVSVSRAPRRAGMRRARGPERTETGPVAAA